MGRKNFLLVMPKVIKSAGEGYAFPLGITYVSSSLKAAGYNVFTLNLNHSEGLIYDILKETIEKNQISVVATGGLSFQYPTIKEIVESTKKINQSLLTIVGGGIITAEPQVALEALEYVDFGVIGEGEITICNLAQCIESNGDFDAVNGIIYKKENYYHSTIPQPENADIDSLPYPDYDGFGLLNYLELPASSVNNLITHRMVYICGSRSCPYRCTFCFHTTGKKYRLRPIESVIKEIEYMKTKYNIGFVCMTDELFARDKKRVKYFNDEMNRMNIPWSASFRADDVNEELIAILKNGTCASMSFGLESADNAILKSMKKHITIEKIENTLKMVYEAGIPVAGNFIFGDIEETYETATKTLQWWKDHAQYCLGLNLITTYPGSYLYQHACSNNIITDRVKFLKDGCPQVNVSKMNETEFGAIAKEIFELPYKYGKQVKDIESIKMGQNGRVTISGKCCDCATTNTWTDIKLFVGNSWLPCSNCGQKHYVPLLSELQENIVKNIEKLLTIYDKIAVWGITYYSIPIIENNNIFQNDRLFIIDNAASKQMMTLSGKTVNDPAIISKHQIDTVIVFYPNSIKQISSLIQNFHPSVRKIYDICDLATNNSNVN